MRFVVASIAALALFGGACVSPSVAVCEENCTKRGACIGDVDVDQCKRACSDSAPVGSDACVAAQDEVQRCRVAQVCDDYVDGVGCEAEEAAVADACAP